MEEIIKVENLCFEYEPGLQTISNISFQSHKGEYVAILGHNGSGKSTIAKLLIGLLEKKSGEIYIDDYQLNLENLYKITGGKVSYGDAVDLYKKAFYLSKSKLRTKRSVQVLNRLLDNNPKYYNTLKYILKKGYGIEPEITTRISKNLVSVSESVSLDINNNKSELVDYINSLNEKYLTYILDSPNNAFEILLPRFLESKDIHSAKNYVLKKR